MKNEWQLQDAKNRFSQVVNEAVDSGPQWVTRHGKRTVVVLSADDYEAIAPEENSSFLEWLRSCPGGELAEKLDEVISERDDDDRDFSFDN